MIRFLDGPAAGVTLSLRRAPVLLRVVRATTGSAVTWDALDQEDDQPKRNEQIFLYRNTGELTGFCLIDYQDGQGRRRGTHSAIAQYRFVPRQPIDRRMRTRDAWLAYCASVQAREGGSRAR